MSWDTGLSGSALNIAETGEKRLRVVAGPGTGKSFALKRRVARLLEQNQDPARIMVVTFTRNAAANLVQDLADLNIVGCEKVHVGTLHAYCFSLLSQEDVLEYLGRVPRTIVTLSKAGSLQFEGGVLLDDLVSDQFGSKRECTKRIRAFEAAWARLQSEEPGWPVDPIDQLFQKRLIAWLRFHRAMLVGELVPEALRFLRNNPMSNALTAFDHVIVDEYQDLNRAEQEIIDLLANKSAMAVAGDADQSIYSFRHANPEGIDHFLERYPEAHDESLNECRRCPTRVVTIADQLIRNNHQPNFHPRLKAMPGNCEGQIYIIQWGSPEKEAQGIAKYIRHLLDNRGYTPRDILLITPRRQLAYRIRDVIGKLGITVHSFYQEEALEKDSAQRAFALLTLLSNKEDRVALRWWLGHQSQSGLSGSYRKLRQHCESSGQSPRVVLEEIDRGDLKLAGVSRLLEKFRELKQAVADLSELKLSDLVDRLLPPDDDACTALREVAVMELRRSETAYELFDHIKAYITQPEVPEGDYVKIMSPQKAKGLTSKVVIVTGCIEGLFPIVDDTLPPKEQNASIREQRRLFYVAITRCTDILVLSSITNIEHRLAMNIRAELRGGRAIASRFIYELGPTAPDSLEGSIWQAQRFSD